MQASPRHHAFREFRSAESAAWLASLGVDYFDFSDLKSIDGDPSEFIDPYHPSEPAYLRMLIRMASKPEVADLLGVDTDYLASRLSSATRLEVFRNEFRPAAMPSASHKIDQTATVYSSHGAAH